MVPGGGRFSQHAVQIVRTAHYQRKRSRRATLVKDARQSSKKPYTHPHGQSRYVVHVDVRCTTPYASVSF